MLMMLLKVCRLSGCSPNIGALHFVTSSVLLLLLRTRPYFLFVRLVLLLPAPYFLFVDVCYFFFGLFKATPYFLFVSFLLMLLMLVQTHIFFFNAGDTFLAKELFT